MTNFDMITNSLIYKQLNPPQYRKYKFNNNSYLGTVLSKAVHLRFDVQGIGKITQYFIYDINNKIVKYRFSFYSENQRIKDLKKNKRKEKEKKMKEKEKRMKKNEENEF